MRSREAPHVGLALAFFAACDSGGGAPSSPDAGPPDASGPDAPVACPDPPPPPEACDFFLGCGCDAAMGEKCTVLSDGKLCFAAGTAHEWDPCASEGDCAAGAACIGYAGTNVCMTFCDDAHACPQDESCYVNITDGMMPPTQLAEVCGQVCSLLDQDCRFAPQGCYSSTEIARPEHGLCTSAGTGLQGDPCTRANDCSVGHLCITPSGGASICAQLCDRADGNPACGQGSCQPLNGHTQTGVCLTP
jgi:hypothetical protein